MSEVKKTVEILVAGGKVTAGPPLGPALGPLGVNVLAIVNKINEVTKDYSGMKVPVKVTVDVDSKNFEVTVGTPTTSALIVSELKAEKGSSSPKEQKIGNLNMDQVIKIAKIKLPELLSTNLKLATKEVMGSCISIGVTIDGRDPKEVQKEVDDGKYDSILIKEE